MPSATAGEDSVAPLAVLVQSGEQIPLLQPMVPVAL